MRRRQDIPLAVAVLYSALAALVIVLSVFSIVGSIVRAFWL